MMEVQCNFDRPSHLMSCVGRMNKINVLDGIMTDLLVQMSFTAGPYNRGGRGKEPGEASTPSSLGCVLIKLITCEYVKMNAKFSLYHLDSLISDLFPVL